MNTAKSSVLVVDDDQDTRTYISRFLSSRGYAVDCLASGEQVMARVQSPECPSAMLLDLLMPTIGGLEVLAQMEKVGRRVPTIVISGVGRVDTVVKAMKLGASDYLLKPFDDEDLELALESAVEDSAHNRGIDPAPGVVHSFSRLDFATVDKTVARIKEMARRVADTDVPVLILGESGVGKEVLARFIHGVSKRHEKPFVKVNCAALPEDLLESELFGYERGAFTGALRDKLGKFELANRGTILLDEIGEMKPQLQAKLLHVLQDGEFPRLGATRVVRVDARIVAATNINLKDAVAKREFREDLFYRLNVIKFEVPPLRERREDIPLLCNYFLTKFQGIYGRPSAPLPSVLMDAFRGYHWPGNVRQLENAVKRFVVLPDIDLILSDLKEEPATAVDAPEAGQAGQTVSLKHASARAADQVEKEMILRALEETNWNRKQVARDLNICYKSLLNKLRRWQIPGRGRAATATARAAEL